jgi:hypothetical protein
LQYDIRNRAFEARLKAFELMPMAPGNKRKFEQDFHWEVGAAVERTFRTALTVLCAPHSSGQAAKRLPQKISGISTLLCNSRRALGLPEFASRHRKGKTHFVTSFCSQVVPVEDNGELTLSAPVDTHIANNSFY